jgi:hypothetical protein
MAASMKMAIFWVVAPCSLVEVYRCFRGTWLPLSSPWWWGQQVPLKCQWTSARLHGATIQKTAIFKNLSVTKYLLTDPPSSLVNLYKTYNKITCSVMKKIKYAIRNVCSVQQCLLATHQSACWPNFNFMIFSWSLTVWQCSIHVHILTLNVIWKLHFIW